MKKIILGIVVLVLIALGYNTFMNYKFHQKLESAQSFGEISWYNNGSITNPPSEKYTKIQVRTSVNGNYSLWGVNTNKMTLEDIKFTNDEFKIKSPVQGKLIDGYIKKAESFKDKWLFQMW